MLLGGILLRVFWNQVSSCHLRPHELGCGRWQTQGKQAELSWVIGPHCNFSGQASSTFYPTGQVGFLYLRNVGVLFFFP